MEQRIHTVDESESFTAADREDVPGVRVVRVVNVVVRVSQPFRLLLEYGLFGLPIRDELIIVTAEVLAPSGPPGRWCIEAGHCRRDGGSIGSAEPPRDAAAGLVARTDRDVVFVNCGVVMLAEQDQVVQVRRAAAGPGESVMSLEMPGAMAARVLTAVVVTGHESATLVFGDQTLFASYGERHARRVGDDAEKHGVAECRLRIRGFDGWSAADPALQIR